MLWVRFFKNQESGKIMEGWEEMDNGEHGK
jgi:hypothetical protein